LNGFPIRSASPSDATGAGLVTPVLLVSYRYRVRFTVIGSLLNDRHGGSTAWARQQSPHSGC